MKINRAGELQLHSIVLLIAICGLAPLTMTLAVPVLPEMSDLLGVSTKEIQYMISAFLIGLGLAQPIQGILADRFGRRCVLLANFFVFTLACLLTTLTLNWSLLILLRVVQGATVSAGSICCRAMLTDLQDKEAAGVSFSYLVLGGTMGALVAPLLGAYLGSVYGWRSVFIFLAVAGFSIAVIAWFKVSETLRSEFATNNIQLKPILKNYAVLLGSAVFLGYTLMNVFCQGIFFVFLPIGAEFFSQGLQLPDNWFVGYWLLITAIFIVGNAFAAFSVKRYGNARTLRFACCAILLIGLAFLGTILLPSLALWSPLLSLVFAMLLTGMISPLAMNGAVANFPSISGAAAGLSGALGMIGGGLFSLLSGVMYNGTLWPMTCLAAACTLGIFLMFLLVREPFIAGAPKNVI